MKDEDYRKLINNTVRECHEIIKKTTIDCFDEPSKRVDFVISSCIHLLGNMCLEISHQNMEVIEKNAEIVVISVSKWFEEIIREIKKGKLN